MASPEMFRMAQEMMAKMSPEQLAEMQRAAANMTPEQMRQAQAMASSLTPDQLRQAQQAASGMSPEELLRAQRMAAAGGAPGMAPSQAGGGGAEAGQMSAQQKYQYDASMQLKNEGNAFHGQQRYSEAATKYERALSNLTGHTSQAARELRASCQGNLASCFLQLGRLQECVEQCNAVLAADSSNRKALYRRGQAYTGLNRAEEAVRDLQRALALSPEAEKGVISSKLQEAQEKQRLASRGVVIEEVTEPAPAPAAAATAERQGGGEEDSSNQPGVGPEEAPAGAAQEADGQIDDVPEPSAVHTPAPEDGPLLQEARPAAAATASSGGAAGGAAGGAGGAPFMPGAGPNVDPQQVQQIAQMVKDNPSLMQMAADNMRSMSDEQLAQALAQGGQQGVTPAMARAMAESLRGMPQEQLRAMADQAAAAAGSGAAPAPGAGPGASAEQMRAATEMVRQNPEMLKNIGRMMESMPPEQLEAMAASMPGAPPGMKFDVNQMKMAARMMESMAPEDLERMAQMAGGMGGAGPGAAAAAAAASPGGAAAAPAAGSREGGGASAQSAAPSAPFAITPEMAAAAAAGGGAPEDQMRAATEAMRQNPDMLKNIGRMMESMPPEQLEAMAASMPGAPPGMKLDAEQMRAAARMMESMSPEDLERMAQMARGMGAGPAGAGGAPGMPPGLDGASFADIRRKFEDPATVKMMQGMMKSMDPEQLAKMMSASGMKVTPEQAKKMVDSMGNLSEGQVELIARITGYLNRVIDAYQRTKALVLSQGLLVLALVALVVAVLLRWLGWV